MDEKKIMVGFYVDPDLKEMLEQLAAAADRNQGSYLRTLIREKYVEYFGGTSPTPCTDDKVNGNGHIAV